MKKLTDFLISAPIYIKIVNTYEINIVKTKDKTVINKLKNKILCELKMDNGYFKIFLDQLLSRLN